MNQQFLSARRMNIKLFGVPRVPLVRTALVCCALALASVPTSFAQTIDAGTIRGHVADQNGAAIVGAEVRVTNDVTGLSRTAHTDDGGNYTVTGLPLTGAYKMTITSSG